MSYGKLEKVIAKEGAERFVKTGEVRPITVYQSFLGRYFVGRTQPFPLAANHEGIVIFANPSDNDRRVFLKIVTLTGNVDRRFLFLFDAKTAIPLRTSDAKTTTHRGLETEPRAEIKFGTAQSVPIPEEMVVLQRLFVGGETAEIDQEGKFILEPGHNHAIKIQAVSADDLLDLAFGWWEEPLFGAQGAQ